MAERRILLSLGANPLYVPRGISPFLMARRLSRAARVESPDLTFVREALTRKHRPKSKHESDGSTPVAA